MLDLGLLAITAWAEDAPLEDEEVAISLRDASIADKLILRSAASKILELNKESQNIWRYNRPNRWSMVKPWVNWVHMVFKKNNPLSNGKEDDFVNLPTIK